MTIELGVQVRRATTTSHAVVTGSFDSAYTMKVASTRSGGPPMPGVAPGAETHMTIEAKWLGACAAGQKPGDVVMSNGMTMNVLDMQKMRGARRSRAGLSTSRRVEPSPLRRSTGHLDRSCRGNPQLCRCSCPRSGSPATGSRVTATRISLSPAISTSVGSYSIQPAPGR